MILQNKKTGVLGVLEATTYHGGRPDNIVEVYEMGWELSGYWRNTKR